MFAQASAPMAADTNQRASEQRPGSAVGVVPSNVSSSAPSRGCHQHQAADAHAGMACPPLTCGAGTGDEATEEVLLASPLLASTTVPAASSMGQSDCELHSAAGSAVSIAGCSTSSLPSASGSAALGAASKASRPPSASSSPAMPSGIYVPYTSPFHPQLQPPSQPARASRPSSAPGSRTGIAPSILAPAALRDRMVAICLYPKDLPASQVQLHAAASAALHGRVQEVRRFSFFGCDRSSPSCLASDAGCICRARALSAVPNAFGMVKAVFIQLF